MDFDHAEGMHIFCGCVFEGGAIVRVLINLRTRILARYHAAIPASCPEVTIHRRYAPLFDINAPPWITDKKPLALIQLVPHEAIDFPAFGGQ
ncbi:MAG: hypothetical protein AAGA58_05420 [Verrucomicrobiota bacterium]